MKYLEPQKQLLIATLLNELCELTLEDFDVQKHVDDAQQVINALDDRVQQSASIGIKTNYDSISDTKEQSGHTDAGDVQTSFKKETNKEFKLGVNEYRIGNYVATKHKHRHYNILQFEHFMRRSDAANILGKDTSTSNIKYQTASLKVVEFYKSIPVTKRFWIFSIVTHKDIILWSRDKKTVNIDL